MRGYVPDYDLRRASTLNDALTLMAQGHRPFAGGTDLMVVFETGKLVHKKFVSILGLPELQGIELSPTHVTLGALTTYAQLQTHPVLQTDFPSLVAGAQHTGARAIQNRGTLGGNIANASPAADSPPALLCVDAEIELVSQRGSRWLPYADFHTGYKQTRMAPDELITRIKLPRRAGLQHYYRKVGTRRAQAISKVCVCAAFTPDLSHVRIALGSVGPITVRALKTEQVLQQGGTIAEVRAALAAEITPLDDIRSTRDYRLLVAQNLIEACFGPLARPASRAV